MVPKPPLVLHVVSARLICINSVVSVTSTNRQTALTDSFCNKDSFKSLYKLCIWLSLPQAEKTKRVRGKKKKSMQLQTLENTSPSDVSSKKQRAW